ncbi:hypothetical protein CCH79_00003271 [Gambusia affinis]|uniref:Neurabin-1/2 PDZ domain-containing protein n=1 Tax=Gambusia affinis TaxID=33528 RepID=A0A315VD96_GAMAF|nr:hypothetical protein CCH79_00003271 [Gambusia affinis]
MMKTESTSKSTSSTLRSPSPHRNAYEAGMQALKPVKDGAANGDLQEGPRGRRYGSNVHRIKNMFQQMQTTTGGDVEAEDGARTVRLSLPRAGSLNENVDHSALLKLGSTVSERVNKFDPKAENGHQRASSPSYSKLQETRRIFEQQQQEKQERLEKLSTTRVLLKTDKTPAFQDGRLDMVSRFNGSTESLDSLDTSEAVSPTVGVLNSKIITKRVSAFASGHQEEEISNQKGREGAPRGLRGRVMPPSESINGGKSASKCPPTEHSSNVGESIEQREKTVVDVGVEAKEIVQHENLPAAKGPNSTGDLHGSVENGQDAAEVKSSPKTDEMLAQVEEKEDEDDDRTQRDDKSERDLTNISTCSTMGDDYGESQKDEEEEEGEEEECDERYEPESSCVEIPGLPVEEDPPPSRKICFSTEPIKVRRDATLKHLTICTPSMEMGCKHRGCYEP